MTRIGPKILAARVGAASVARPESSKGVEETTSTPFGDSGRATPRLVVLADFPEEGWPSMDLAAQMLYRQVVTGYASELRAECVCPRFHHRATCLPFVGKKRLALNTDRLANRLWDYPRQLRRRLHEFDLFHVVDHSYAQLVHLLPPERTGVFCHDLDTFRCLLEPAREPRPRWFRAVARRILHGLQKAAVVFHSTLETRRQVERFGLIDPQRLVHAPYGISPEFTTDDPEQDEPPASPFLLHVGSCIPRKRMDVLLNVFAEVRAHYPELRLVKVGGPWLPQQRDQIDHLGIAAAITPHVGINRDALAKLYRQAVLVLMPSEAEGFGLPVIEALACGSIVVASDLAVLREVGGQATVYCPVGDVASWSQTVCRLLANPAQAPPRSARIAQAQRFSWAAHAETIVNAYLRLAKVTAKRP